MTSSQYGDGVVFLENCVIHHGAIVPRWPVLAGVDETTVGWAGSPRWAHQYIRNDEAVPVSRYLWVSSAAGLYDGSSLIDLGGSVVQSQFDTLSTHGVLTCAPQTPRKLLLDSPYTLSTCSFSGDTPGDPFGIVHEFKGRMYYAEGSGKSPNFYYTAVNAVDGALTSFDLAEFGGGPVVAIESLTRDGGSGPDDYIAFFCHNDVAFVYQGANPGDALDWSLVGKFTIPKPGVKNEEGISERCVMQIPGDIIILCDIGLVSLRETMISNDSTYRIASWALEINDIIESWLNLPFGGPHNHIFLREVPSLGLICVNAVGEIDAFSPGEIEGAMYVYDTIHDAWSRYGIYKGNPTRHGDQQDVWLVYDSDVIANGDPDRRAYDYVFADITPDGRCIVLPRIADSSAESEVNCPIQKEFGKDGVGSGHSIQCSVLWAIRPLEKLTSFTEARIDGALYSGTLDSISLHIEVDGNVLEKQFEVTTGWQFFVHQSIGVQGHAVQARLDFTYTPPASGSPSNTRDVVNLIPRMQIFGINLLEQQSSGL